MCPVRHISQYVQNRSDLFCHFSDAPRPWGMQPNTSLRLRMCISPLMSRPNIIPFSPCPNPLHRQTFLHPNCQNRPNIFSHPSPCTSFIAICVSQSKTTTRNKQPRILPPPFSNPPTPRNDHRQKDKEYQRVKEHSSHNPKSTRLKTAPTDHRPKSSSKLALTNIQIRRTCFCRIRQHTP